MSEHRAATIALHGGHVLDPTTNARAVPIYAGVTQDTVRLSVGIEHIDDILTDLDLALAKSRVAVHA